MSGHPTTFWRPKGLRWHCFGWTNRASLDPRTVHLAPHQSLCGKASLKAKPGEVRIVGERPAHGVRCLACDVAEMRTLDAEASLPVEAF